MTRILLRAHKSPFRAASAEETLARNLVGDNAGNLVFAEATFRLLSTTGTEIKTSGVHRSAAEEVNERYDHVVVPLANAFRGGYVEPLNRLSEVIERLTVPVSVVGVGAQASVGGTQPRRDEVEAATSRFVRAVLERSPSIGVRGQFTAEYLSALGFPDDQVDVIGCPSMFMHGPVLPAPRLVDHLERESPIALNVSPYVTAMGPISLHHAERYPHLVYLAQNLPSLELLLDGHYTYPEDKLRKQADAGLPVTLEHPLIRENRVRFPLDPRAWVEHLRSYDFSFGTRIHGNIVAVLAGVPALVLAHDARTLELAQYHEIPHRLIGDLDANVDAADLYDEADWTPMGAGHGARWDTFATFLARHRLSHVFEPGQSPDAFDRRMAQTELPPPVETLMGLSPEELYAMHAELRSARGKRDRRPARGGRFERRPLASTLARGKRRLSQAVSRRPGA